MSLTVKKAEIFSSLFLKFSYERQDLDVKNIVSTQSDAPIHDDLRNAFRSLIPHFAFVCEMVTDEKLVGKALENISDYIGDKDSVVKPDFLKFRVYGFSISKTGEGVILSGSKSLENGNEISFSTPMIKFDSDYKFTAQLEDTVELLKEEVMEYMSGKQAPKAQMEMFSDEEDLDEEI